MRLLIVIIFWFFLCNLIIIGSLLYSLNKPQVLSDNTYRSPLQIYNSLYQPSPTKFVIKVPKKDIRSLALSRFLKDNNSVLESYADEIIKQADINGFDYAIIPAIAMQESGGCKRIISQSYNCWGFGIYGNTVTKFKTYNEAIEHVSKSIKEAYINNGLTNMTLLENKWAPQSGGSWSSSVNYFIGKIRDYERNTPNT